MYFVFCFFDFQNSISGLGVRLCACFAPAVSQIPFAGKGVLVKLTCGLRPEAVTLRFLNILSTVVGRAKIQVSHFNYPPFFVFQNFGLYMSSVRIQIGLSIQASVHQAWLDITAICAMLRLPFLRRAYKEPNRRTAAGPWLFLIILALAVCAVVCRVFPRALLPCWVIA